MGTKMAAGDVAAQMVTLWQEAQSLAERIAVLPEPYRMVVLNSFQARVRESTRRTQDAE